MQLAPDLQAAIDRLVADGLYENDEAVLRRAIEDLAERETVLAGVREALADVDAGRMMNVDESEHRVRSRLGFGSES